MATLLRRNGRSRRVLVVTVVVCGLLSFAVYAWVYGAAYVAFWSYQPLEGDIVFQSLPHSPLVDAIEGVTASPYSHCGIVAQEKGRWVVYEAFHNVEATPLKQFLFRGRDLRFAVYRLKSRFQQYVPATIANTKTYLGRPYDVRYRMDDERLYCSELIYKAYHEASGQQFGKMVRLSDLNWKPFARTIEHFEKGPVPTDREMITPKDLSEAEQLEPVLLCSPRIAPPPHLPIMPSQACTSPRHAETLFEKERAKPWK